MNMTMILNISDVRKGQRPGMNTYPTVFVPSFASTPGKDGKPVIRPVWVRAQYRPRTMAHPVGRWAILRPEGGESGRVISEVDAPLWFDQYEEPFEREVDDPAD